MATDLRARLVDSERAVGERDARLSHAADVHATKVMRMNEARDDEVMSLKEAHGRALAGLRAERDAEAARADETGREARGAGGDRGTSGRR